MSKIDIFQLEICPICGADLRYGKESMITNPTPAYLAEMLSAHYGYHNLENLKTAPPKVSNVGDK